MGQLRGQWAVEEGMKQLSACGWWNPDPEVIIFPIKVISVLTSKMGKI